MADARRPSNSVHPAPLTLKRHHCLQLFAAEARLGPDGPEEAFLVLKLQHRAFTTSVIRREAAGVYRWSGGKGPLHEWVIDGARSQRREILRAYVFAVEVNPEAYTRDDEGRHAESSSATSRDQDDATANGDDERAEGSATTPRDEDASGGESSFQSTHSSPRCGARVPAVDGANGVASRCLGFFEVPLLGLREHGATSAVNGGPLLQGPEYADRSPSGGATSHAGSFAILSGSLSLRLAWESRAAFLHESGALSRRTEELCGVLAGLAGGVEHFSDSAAALDALTSWPSSPQKASEELRASHSLCWPPRLPSRSSPKLFDSRGFSTEPDGLDPRRLDLESLPIHAIVADQQHRVDSLKEVLANSQQNHKSASRAGSCPQRQEEARRSELQGSDQVYCGAWRGGRGASDPRCAARQPGTKRYPSGSVPCMPPGRHLARRVGRHRPCRIEAEGCRGSGQPGKPNTQSPHVEPYTKGMAVTSLETLPSCDSQLWTSCRPGSEVERFLREHAHMHLDRDLLLSAI